NTNNLFFISPDHLGAPHLIADAKGKKVWSWNHDPFGSTDPVGQGNFTFNLRFPGQIHDDETGFNYNHFRDYRSDMGRYVENDPLGLLAGLNTYGYVGGNPVSLTDRLGLAVDINDSTGYEVFQVQYQTIQLHAHRKRLSQTIHQNNVGM